MNYFKYCLKSCFFSLKIFFCLLLHFRHNTTHSSSLPRVKLSNVAKCNRDQKKSFLFLFNLTRTNIQSPVRHQTERLCCYFETISKIWICSNVALFTRCYKLKLFFFGFIRVSPWTNWLTSQNKPLFSKSTFTRQLFLSALDDLNVYPVRLIWRWSGRWNALHGHTHRL